jgi:hypothetical protein
MAEGRRRRVANLAEVLRPLGAAERTTLREAAAILQNTLSAQPREGTRGK